MQTETEIIDASGMTDEELIFAWRFEQLQRAGFDSELALDLAVCAGSICTTQLSWWSEAARLRLPHRSSSRARIRMERLSTLVLG
jgi:hypothetical protein